MTIKMEVANLANAKRSIIIVFPHVALTLVTVCAVFDSSIQFHAFEVVVNAVGDLVALALAGESCRHCGIFCK